MGACNSFLYEKWLVAANPLPNTNDQTFVYFLSFFPKWLTTNLRASLNVKVSSKNKTFPLIYIQVINTIYDRYGINPTFCCWMLCQSPLCILFGCRSFCRTPLNIKFSWSSRLVSQTLFSTQSEVLSVPLIISNHTIRSTYQRQNLMSTNVIGLSFILLSDLPNSHEDKCTLWNVIISCKELHLSDS